MKARLIKTMSICIALFAANLSLADGTTPVGSPMPPIPMTLTFDGIGISPATPETRKACEAENIEGATWFDIEANGDATLFNAKYAIVRTLKPVGVGLDPMHVDHVSHIEYETSDGTVVEELRVLAGFERFNFSRTISKSGVLTTAISCPGTTGFIQPD